MSIVNNRVGLIGRLTKDPDIRSAGSTTVANFTLAVDRKVKKDNEPSADFIGCTAFGKIAEVIEKHCSKGAKIAIDGRIKTGNYKDKDGKTVYTTTVIVESLEFCERKSSSNTQQEQSGPSVNDFMSLPDGIDEELPFS